MEAVTIAGMAGMLAMTWKVIDFLRMLANLGTNRSGVVTQLLAWIGAVLVVLLYAGSELGGIAVPGTELLLQDADLATKIILGLSIGSAASVAVDFKQAIDGSDSAAKPEMLGGSS